jgi:hypothetical protein
MKLPRLFSGTDRLDSVVLMPERGRLAKDVVAEALVGRLPAFDNRAALRRAISRSAIRARF